MFFFIFSSNLLASFEKIPAIDIPAKKLPNLTQNSASLSSCLKEAIEDTTPKKLRKNIGAALINLTGVKRKENPDVAFYHETRGFYAASAAKLAPLVAAFQLKADMEYLTNTQTTLPTSLIIWNTPNKSNPELASIFQSKNGYLSLPVTFKQDFLELTDSAIRASNNKSAAKVMTLLTMPYIGNAMIRLDLYSKDQNGGLWAGKLFGKGRQWLRSPVNNRSHNATPYSLSLLFTALAQKNLISKDASLGIRKILTSTKFNIKFVKGLRQMGYTINQRATPTYDKPSIEIYRKSGTYIGPITVHHDAAYIVKSTCHSQDCRLISHRRYVAVALSQGSPFKSILPKLIQKMDKCIDQS